MQAVVVAFGRVDFETSHRLLHDAGIRVLNGLLSSRFVTAVSPRHPMDFGLTRTRVLAVRGA